MKKKFAIFSFLFFSLSIFSQASITVSPNLQSNMVLQQNSSFTISGTGTINDQIQVNCSWEADTENHNTTVSSDGLWSITVQTPTASFDSRTIVVKGMEQLVFSNILVGEVWLCSGQSNMLFFVKDVANGATEVSNADLYPNIRLLNMYQVQSDIPTDSFSAKWSICSSSSIPYFSAVGYFFGLKLLQDLNVPIGLIDASWGDTTGEVWTERNSVLNCGDTAVVAGASRNDTTPRSDPTIPYKIGNAFNAMIYPLRNIPIAGAIWYQGESNEGYPYYYPSLLKTLVQGYRQLWKTSESKFPFYIAQICPYNRIYDFPTYYANPTMRFMQAQASELIPNSGIESNDDIANLSNIHPTNKQDVGLRMAWLALNNTYGKSEYENKLTSLYQNYLIDNDKMIITFKNVGVGLKTKDGTSPTMFEIAGSDKVFYPAVATISGIDKVVLSSRNVANPIAARLGWSYVKTTNLVNSENLPVSVFKTYSWLDTNEEPTVYSQPNPIVADFDSVTPLHDAWGGVTGSISVPPTNPTGNAYLVNVPANNNGGGFWINTTFAKNQFKQLKFNIQSSVPITMLFMFESADQVKTWGGGYDKWYGYTNVGNWQEFKIDLTDINASGRLVILPNPWQNKPAFSLYFDNEIFYASSTGINETKIGSQISIYPNPTSDLVNIKMDENEKWANIKLFTTDGKLVYNKHTTNDTEQINLKKLNVSGLLLANITTASRNEIYKIVVN